jgi:hypothetical protein
MLPKRISAETMDEGTYSSDSVVERTSEPHIVVACPSCKTKFAVESSLVASYEVPRFHCSRCDSIFDLRPKQKITEQSDKALASGGQRWVLDDGAAEATHMAPHNADVGQRSPSQTTLKATDFTLGTIPNPDTLEPRTPFEPIEDRAGLSILGFRPTASRRHTTSITRAEAQSIAAHAQPATQAHPAPREVEELEKLDDPFALFDTPGATPNVLIPTPSPAKQSSTNNTVAHTPPPSPQPSSPELLLGESKEPVKATAASRPRETIQRSSRAGFFSRLSDRTYGLTRLSIPLLVALGVLCIVSVATRLMPFTMDAVFGAVTPGFISGRTAHIPPRELSVQDLNLSLEKTQSKETIPVIRGFVNNISDKTFEDVSIEALGFNARGELLVRARAPLRSALSREKISDLPLDTVRKFQNVLSASDASIKAGEKVAFAVALFVEGVEPHEVTYFSARVFSVGQAR